MQDLARSYVSKIMNKTVQGLTKNSPRSCQDLREIRFFKILWDSARFYLSVFSIQATKFTPSIKNGLFQKKTKGLRTCFCKSYLGLFHFFTLPLKIPGKTKLHPWKFRKTVLDPMAPPLEIQQHCVRSLGNSTLFLLGNPLEIPLCF